MFEAGTGGAVEDPLHGAADRGEERELEHAAVVDDVQVHDRRGAEPRQLPAVDGAGRQQAGRVVVRDGQHDRIGRQDGALPAAIWKPSPVWSIAVTPRRRRTSTPACASARRAARSWISPSGTRA